MSGKFEGLQIPKDAILDGTNYIDWKKLVTSVLKNSGLLKVLNEPETEEKDVISSNHVETFLLFSMNREQRNLVGHCSNAQEIWQTITSKFESVQLQI